MEVMEMRTYMTQPEQGDKKREATAPIAHISGRCVVLLLLGFAWLMMGCSLEDRKQEAKRLYEAGLNAMDEKRPDDAIAYFQEAVEKDPSHAKAHYQLGRLYLKSNLFNRAENEFSMALRGDPLLVEAKRSLAELFYQRGAHEKAVLLYRELVEDRAEDPDIRMALGDSLRQIGDVDEARKVVEKTASDYPGDLSIQLDLARFYEKSGRPILTIETFEMILEKFPKSTLPHVAFMEFHMREGRLERAEKIAREALEHDHIHKDLYQNLFRIAHKRRNYSTALGHLEAAVAELPNDPDNWMLLGDYLLFLKKYSRALDVYDTIVKKWPGLKQVEARIAEVYMAQGNYEKAANYIEELLAKAPGDARAYLLRGLLWIREGKTAEARSEILKAREIDPESAEGHYFYGLSFLKEQEYDLSLPEILRAVETQPDSIKARLTLAYIYFKTEQFNLALNELDLILGAEPDNLGARSLRAAVSIRLKNYDAAAADYRDMIEQGHATPEMRFHLTHIYKTQGKLGPALKAIEDILKEDTDSFKGLEEKARIYAAMGAYEKAISACDVYLKKRPEDLQISLLKAAVLLKQENHKEAERFLRHLMKAHPGSDKIYRWMANALIKQKKYKEALSHYQRSIEQNPEAVDTYMEMASIHKHLGEFDRAVEAYEAVLQIDGLHGPAANDLAYLYADRGENLDRALSLAIRASEQIPESAAVSDTLGWAYLKRGSVLLAKMHLNKAVRREPRKALFHYHLGVALRESEDMPGSRKALQEAVRLGLDGKELADAEKMLQEMKTKGGAQG